MIKKKYDTKCDAINDDPLSAQVWNGRMVNCTNVDEKATKLMMMMMMMMMVVMLMMMVMMVMMTMMMMIIMRNQANPGVGGRNRPEVHKEE